MFNNDVTQSYNNQDATGEILIMLLGAFLFGCLMCWLLRKLFSESDSSQGISSTHLHSESHAQSEVTSNVRDSNHSTQMADKAHTVKSNKDKPYSTPRIDDLTKITGITPKVQSTLKHEGIHSYTDLRDIGRHSLQYLQDKLVDANTNKKEIETWPHQASLAAKGDWNKLKDYQAFVSQSQKTPSAVEKTSTSNSSDDLTVIEGIDPKIKEILHSKGINTFQQLSNSDTELLKRYLVEADSHLSKHETESWPHQAAMAEKGQWEELQIYQDFMHAETSVASDDLHSPQSNLEDNISDNELNDYDDLKKIEGIGPKIEELLNKNGIYTFSQLHNSKQDRLQGILNEAGNPFNKHNPETWSYQAGMAHNNDWKGLIDYQKSLQNINENSSSVKTTDDLKKIEGIGPKIQALLGKAGIHTFKDLSEQKRDDLKKLLDAGGPQYRVHEPESWPQQAKLANEGKWEDLQKLQDALIGGRSNK